MPNILSSYNIGYVYVIKNINHPENCFKIGVTTMSSEERLEDLNIATGELFGFENEFSWCVTKCKLLEKQLHLKLKDYRIRKEFFDISFNKISDTVHKICSEFEICIIDEYLITKQEQASLLYFTDKSGLFIRKQGEHIIADDFIDMYYSWLVKSSKIRNSEFNHLETNWEKSLFYKKIRLGMYQIDYEYIDMKFYRLFEGIKKATDEPF